MILINKFISHHSILLTIQGIVYTPAKDFYGPDVLVISVDDMGNNGYGLLCAGDLIILYLHL